MYNNLNLEWQEGKTTPSIISVEVPYCLTGLSHYVEKHFQYLDCVRVCVWGVCVCVCVCVCVECTLKDFEIQVKIYHSYPLIYSFNKY